MSWLEPDRCPTVVCDMNFAHNPFILIEIGIVLPFLIIVQWLTGWSGEEVFRLGLIIHAAVLPIIIGAGFWYAYCHIPKRWYDDWHKEHDK